MKKMERAKKENKEKEKFIEKRNELKQLEDFYLNANFDNLPELIQERRKENIDKLIEFQNNYVKINYDKYGNAHKEVNPYLISTYFFKSVNPLSIKEPKYNAEKLSIVWDLYMYLIEQVNMKIAPFSPSLSHFCKFAGISITTLNKYKTSGEEDMMNLCNKIYDETMAGNFELAQFKVVNEKSTLSRLKIENQIVEKTQPSVHINITEKPDMKAIEEKIAKYKIFADKKGGK